MEIEYLLNNFWCIKDENPKEYFNIKNKLDDYKDLIQTKLGSKLIVNERFIKLEKIPAKPKSYMGISEFKSILEYNILFIILLFLEDKPKNEQFILSDLIEYIDKVSTTLKLDNVPNWIIQNHRKCLVTVVEYLKSLNIIKAIEEINNFTDDRTAEALYETTGLSNYYIREFKGDITKYEKIEDYVNDEFEDQTSEIGDIRRYKVYRHLFYSLAAYSSDLTEAEKDYLKRFRGIIEGEIEKYTNASLEMTKNMSTLLYDEDVNNKLFYPNNKVITDITLLVNSKITEKVDAGELKLNSDETVTIQKEIMHRIIKDVKKENGEYLSKIYREMKSEKYIREVIEYLKEYDFIREEEMNYTIYPMTFRLNGYIPKEKENQLDIFGGENSEI